jgi:hypothetical protein
MPFELHCIFMEAIDVKILNNFKGTWSMNTKKIFLHKFVIFEYSLF